MTKEEYFEFESIIDSICEERNSEDLKKVRDYITDKISSDKVQKLRKIIDKMEKEEEYGYLRSAYNYITNASTIMDTDNMVRVFNREQLEILNKSLRDFIDDNFYVTTVSTDLIQRETYRIYPGYFSFRNRDTFYQWFHMYDLLDVYDEFSEGIKKSYDLGLLIRQLEKKGITVEKYKKHSYEVKQYVDYCEANKEQGRSFQKKHK